MIFGLLLMGLLLMSVALKGTEHELGQRLQMDLLGQDGFIVWIFAILAIGALGYVPGLETASNYLLALVMVVVLVRNGGVWSQLQNALQMASGAGPAPSIAPKPITADGGSNQSGQGGSGGGSGGGSSSSSSGGDSTSSTISEIATVAEIAAVLA